MMSDSAQPHDSRFDRLSPRHKDCLRLTYQRKRTKEIAAHLGLSDGTVSSYCKEAIRIIGARDRIDAAERFAAFEAASAPINGGASIEGVGEAPADPPATAAAADTPPWTALLPFRTRGVQGNDTGILVRLLWIPALAILIAIGFGMLAVGVRAASDLVAGRAAGR